MGFLGLAFMFLRQAKPVLIPQGGYQFGQNGVVHTAAKLPVESIDGRLPQRVAINVVQGLV